MCWLQTEVVISDSAVAAIALEAETCAANYSPSLAIYRVIQEKSALLWETIVWVILSKKVHTNIGLILNGYGVMGIF
jgi:hypothetical protein